MKNPMFRGNHGTYSETHWNEEKAELCMSMKIRLNIREKIVIALMIVLFVIGISSILWARNMFYDCNWMCASCQMN
jgi:hypothetical protein